MWSKKIVFLVIFFTGALTFPAAHARQAYEDSMLKVLQTVHSDTTRAKYLMKMGSHFLNDDPRVAERYYKQGLSINITPPKLQARYRAEMAAGMSHISIMDNNLAGAEQWMEKAFAYARESGNAKTLAFIAGTAVNCYTQLERYDKAIACAQLAIHINDSLGTPEASLDAYNNLGYIYNRLPYFNKALAYYLHALDMERNSKERDRMAALNTYSGLAFSYYEIKKFDSSYYYARLMQDDAVAEEASDIIAASLIQQAGALLKLKRYDEAIQAAEKGLKIVLDHDITYLLSGFYGVLASGYAKKGQPVLAREYVTKSSRYVDTTTASLTEKVDMYNMYADVFEAEGNYKDAFAYKQMAYSAYEQVRDNEVTAQTTYAETLLNTEQKEKQITLLNAVNRKQRIVQWLIAGGLALAVIAIFMALRSYRNKKRLAELLQKSNTEKEIFLKEIHHRVKNNMQIIISLLHMQFRDNKDAEVAAGLKQAQQRIKTMALVHNKLYETEEVVHVYLKEYIGELSEAILAANNPEHKHISVNIHEQQPVVLSLDTAISVGLILNELITNACKYAFKGHDKGHIDVTIGKTGEQYELSVSDNGNGLPDAFDKKSSLGVRLIRNLAMQLGGTASFVSGSGTTVNICFFENQAA